MITSVIITLLALQIPLSPAARGTVSGVLRTASGKPAVGVRVAAMIPPTSPQDVASVAALASIAETDGEGRYRLENIPAGRYYISAGRIDTPTYYPGTLELTSATLVTIAASETVANADFVLRDDSEGRARTDRVYISLPLTASSGFNIRVRIAVEGQARFPVSAGGVFPLIRFTPIRAGRTIDHLFDQSMVSLRMPPTGGIDEYKVSVEDLSKEYSVKSITYGSDDITNDLMRVRLRDGNMVQSMFVRNPGPTALSMKDLSVVLAKTAISIARNRARVSGQSVGTSGTVYISGTPGTLYSNGTYEFVGLPPGLHTIVQLEPPFAFGGLVVVGEEDLEGPRLRPTAVAPLDILSPKPPVEVNKPPGSVGMSSIRGRVLDETSRQPLTEGTVTLNGYSNTRSYALNGEGRFEIDHLLAGTYEFKINVTGYSNGPRPLTVGIENLDLEFVVPQVK